MSEKLFRFTVENTRTRESTSFSGQGETMDQAWKDARKNLDAAYRPKSSGIANNSAGLAVTTAAGSIAIKQVAEFEADGPAAGELDFL